MKFLNVPLLWFILLGGSLFVIDHFRNVKSDQTISITQGDIDKIKAQWKAQSDKKLTSKIMSGLLQDEINHRRLYKEALSLELDYDDVIIKRRLIQKLRFVMTEFSNSNPPSKIELKQYFDKHKSDYIREPAISFRHIFLGNNNSSDQSAAQVSVLLKELNNYSKDNKDWQLLGKPFMQGNYFSNQSEQQLLFQFNSSFVNELTSRKIGQWTGPIDSLYGSHLVFVEKIQPVTEIEFENSMSLIKNDYRQSKRAQNYQLYLDGLADKYPVVLENIDDNLNSLLMHKALIK